MAGRGPGSFGLAGSRLMNVLNCRTAVAAPAAQALLLPLRHRTMATAVAIPSLSLHSSGHQSSRPGQLLAIPLTISTRLRSQHVSLLRTNAVEGAALGVEPDLSEDYIEGSEHWTAGQDRDDDFPYGKADGSHTWHEGDDNVGFVDAISNQIKEAGGPNDHPGQATISWLYLPVIFSGLAFGVQGVTLPKSSDYLHGREPEYLFLVAVLFIFAFIGIEMAKPDKPSNFL